MALGNTVQQECLVSIALAYMRYLGSPRACTSAFVDYFVALEDR